MHVSVRTLHGIRTIVEMAEEQENAPQHASELSNQRYIDENYLIQILNQLKKADIITSKKGPRGGYKLARPPEEITLGQIIKILEGPTVISPCTQPEHSDCEIIDECRTQATLSNVADEIDNLLETVSIADVMDEAVPAKI